MIYLSSEPLGLSKETTALLVGRDRVLESLKRAYSLGFSTLLLADRGAGTTSVARSLQVELQSDGVEVFYANVGEVETLEQLIESLRVAIHGRREPHYQSSLDMMVWDAAGSMGGRWIGGENDPDQPIKALGEGIDGAPLVIIDDIHNGRPISELFGRHRNPVRELPFKWLVCGRRANRPSYLEMSADTFFDAELSLDPLTPKASHELLQRRLAKADASERPVASSIEANLESIVGVGDGNPRQLLAAARELALAGPEGSSKAEDLVERAAALGRPHAMLVAELRSVGRASASDQPLLDRLGWSRSRASQVFAALEAEGLVVASLERKPGSPGRPRKVFSLNAGHKGAAE